MLIETAIENEKSKVTRLNAVTVLIARILPNLPELISSETPDGWHTVSFINQKGQEIIKQQKWSDDYWLITLMSVLGVGYTNALLIRSALKKHLPEQTVAVDETCELVSLEDYEKFMTKVDTVTYTDEFLLKWADYITKILITPIIEIEGEMHPLVNKRSTLRQYMSTEGMQNGKVWETTPAVEKLIEDIMDEMRERVETKLGPVPVSQVDELIPWRSNSHGFLKGYNRGLMPFKPDELQGMWLARAIKMQIENGISEKDFKRWIETGFSPLVLHAVNRLQSVEVRFNSCVIDHARVKYANRARHRPDTSEMTMAERAKAIESYKSSVLMYKTLQDLSPDEKYVFAQSMDFRGRMYTLGGMSTPQSSSVCRSNIRFSKAIKIG